MKYKFKVEKYQYTTQERSWIACQENDTDSYYDVQKDAWRITLNGKVIADGIPFESWAETYVKQWNISRSQKIKDVKKSEQQLLKKLKKRMEKDFEKWLGDLRKREALLELGKPIPGKLRDLSSYFTVQNFIENKLDGE